jgi:hypothetical protein
VRMLDLDEVDVQGRTALVELNMEHIEVMLLPKDEYGALSSSSSLAEKEGAAERGGEEEEAAVGAVRPDCWWRIPPQQTGVMHRPLQRPRRRQRSPRGPGRERPRIRRRRRRYDPAHGPVRTTILREGQGRVDAVVRWGWRRRSSRRSLLAPESESPRCLPEPESAPGRGGWGVGRTPPPRSVASALSNFATPNQSSHRIIHEEEDDDYSCDVADKEDEGLGGGNEGTVGVAPRDCGKGYRRSVGGFPR